MTVTEIQQDLALYRAQRNKILESHQAYGRDGSTYTRADLAECEKQIARLRSQLSIAQNGGQCSHGAVVFGGRR